MVEGLGSPGMGYPFRSSYEMIYFAQKGRRKPPEDKSVRDVLRFPRLKGKTLWPTQKPVALLEVLIRLSSNLDDLVVDPFAGSGATLRAAKNLGRRCLGFDINPAGKQYFETTSWEDGVDAEVAPPVQRSAFQRLFVKK
jgi:site-specific DNA-methyltransferase (adenine-specific)